MKKKSDVRPLIIAALEKLGPSSPRQILDKVGCDEQRLKYYLREMLTAGSVKATGSTMARVYALPSQKLEGAARAVVAAAPPHCPGDPTRRTRCSRRNARAHRLLPHRARASRRPGGERRPADAR